MREIHLSATTDASPEDVFELVANVAGYPDVIDSCTASTVLSEDDDAVTAELTLRQGPSEGTYPVRLQLDRPGGVTMKFEGDAPVRLDAEWRFAGQGDAQCRIDLTARYKASGWSQELILKPIVQRMCSQLLDAVVAAAKRA